MNVFVNGEETENWHWQPKPSQSNQIKNVKNLAMKNILRQIYAFWKPRMSSQSTAAAYVPMPATKFSEYSMETNRGAHPTGVDGGAVMNDAVVHSKLLDAFHKRYGIIPDYEHILEFNYRRLIASGNTVFDIGAHEGRHTRVFSELVGPLGSVWAFEPLPAQFLALEAFNLGRHVKLFKTAVSDYSGRSSFVHARGAPSESGLQQRLYNAPDLADPQTIYVDVVRIDDFLDQIPSLHYVKIDVEGGEIDCLRGAVNVLRRWRPFVTVEYGAQTYSVYGHTRRTLFDFAESIGYVVGDLFGAVCPNVETWNVVCDKVYWDWFLVPQERVVEWQTRLLS